MASSSASWSGIPWTTQSVIGGAGPAQNAAYKNGFGVWDVPDPQVVNTPNPMVMGPFNAAMGLSGQLQQSGQNAVNAGAAGWGQAQGYASQLQSLAGLLSHEFDFNLPYAKQALESGFDPMNAQHDYYQREAMNQIGAQEANSGLGGTPYAAAVSGSTNA